MSDWIQIPNTNIEFKCDPNWKDTYCISRIGPDVTRMFNYYPDNQGPSSGAITEFGKHHPAYGFIEAYHQLSK